MTGNGVRHFLDLTDIPKQTLRPSDRFQPRHEGRARARPESPSRSPARRWR